jgi:hypothetical protein
MKIKKILGWLIVIAIFLGLAFVQAVEFTWEYDVSLLYAFGASIAIIAIATIVSMVVVSLALLAIEWISE